MQWARMLALAAVAASGLALSGCSGRNPLSGKWESESAPVMGQQVNPDLSIEFTRDEARQGGRGVKVRYAIKGKTVAVQPQGEANPLRFTVIDGNHIEQDNGLLRLRYRRVAG